MIIKGKKILVSAAAVLLGVIAAVSGFAAARSSAPPLTVVVDAGHGGYAECFKTENKV